MEEQNAQYHLQDNSDFEGSVVSAAKNHYINKNYKIHLQIAA